MKKIVKFIIPFKWRKITFQYREDYYHEIKLVPWNPLSIIPLVVLVLIMIVFSIVNKENLFFNPYKWF